LGSDKLQDLYCSPVIVRGMGAWGTCGGGEKCVQDLVGESERKNHWEDLGISVRIILKWILKAYEGLDCINLA